MALHGPGQHDSKFSQANDLQMSPFVIPVRIHLFAYVNLPCFLFQLITFHSFLALLEWIVDENKYENIR